MQVAVDMGTRQRHQISLAPPSLVLSGHSRNRKLHGEHADHFEAASWNGPAHADWMCTLEETPDRTREREALVSTLNPDPFSDRARIDRKKKQRDTGPIQGVKREAIDRDTTANSFPVGFWTTQNTIFCFPFSSFSFFCHFFFFFFFAFWLNGYVVSNE